MRVPEESTAKSMASVYCIVLNWNGWRDTVNCISSLLQSSYFDLTILVVDNGSTDDSVHQIRKAFPLVEILETHENLGFAGGNNRGIQLAIDRNARFIWLLNNDTVVTPETLDALVATADADPKLGQVGSVLLYMDSADQVQAWGGGKVNLWTGRTRHYYSPVANKKLEYLTAASVLMPAEVFREVGLLDEEYFMYWEDTDLSFRVRAAGWKLDVAANAIVYHRESATAGENKPKLDRYMTASGVRFLRRFARCPRLAITIMISRRVVKRFLAFEWKRGWAVLAGLSGYRKIEVVLRS